MDLKVLQVHYEKISVFDMLTDIVKIAGIASIQSALDEIAAQQSVQPTDGDGSQNNVVYSHLGCVFRYCPNPDVCRKSEGGCMHPVSG